MRGRVSERGREATRGNERERGGGHAVSETTSSEREREAKPEREAITLETEKCRQS